MVQLAQGLSEKGAGKQLPYCQMFKDMVKHVANHRKQRSLFVMYCDDGAGSDFDMDGSVERKVLERLISELCPGVNIVGRKFSFHENNAL